MSDTYSPQNFLRRASNALLSQYFQAKGLLVDLDIESLPETKIDTIWDALQSLPERAATESDFRQIFLLSRKRHMPVLFNALRTCGEQAQEFRKRNGDLDRAMWIFLQNQDVSEQAYSLAMPERSNRWWRKLSYTGKYNPNLEKSALDALGSRISDYFNQKEGRGELCKVEHHQFLNKQCIFAYPSDYAQEVISYKGNAFDRGIHKPAFEVIFVFASGESCVDIYLAEPMATSKEMFGFWTETILGRKVSPSRKPSFNLDCFRTQDHGLQIPADSQIMDIRVHKLKFTPVGKKYTTITIETNATHNAASAYQQMQEMRVQMDALKQVGLDVSIQADNKKGFIKRRFDISPDSCSLGHEGNDSIIRQLLKTGQIEVSA